MSGLVNAKWVGPAGYVLSDGTHLVPGETVVKIPAGEAENSDNWKPVGSKPKGGGDD